MSKKNYPAVILKIGALVLIAVIGISSVISFIWLIKNPFNVTYVWILYPIVVLWYVVFFFGVIGLFHFYKLMHEIESFKQVTHKTLYYLRRVKLQIVRIVILFVAMMPFVYGLAEKDDAPGLIALLVVIGTITGLFYLLMDVFYRLFHDALTIKKD